MCALFFRPTSRGPTLSLGNLGLVNITEIDQKDNETFVGLQRSFWISIRADSTGCQTNTQGTNLDVSGPNLRKLKKKMLRMCICELSTIRTSVRDRGGGAT